MNKKVSVILFLLCLILLQGIIYVWNKNNKTETNSEDQGVEISVDEGRKTPIKIPERKYTYQDALNSITAEELKKHVYYLASDELEGRMSGKKGNVKAFDYIKKTYEKYGLKTMYDKFKIRRVNPGPHNEIGDDFTQNVYAWIEGNDPVLKNEIVVIGAHGDHIGYGPRYSRTPNRREVHNGADDNASGTAALLVLAKAFSMLKGKNKRTVVFMSFSAEEMGLIGSAHYVRNPKFPIGNPNLKNHVFMLNMDMIGYLDKGKYYGWFASGQSSVDIDRHIRELNQKYQFAIRITSRRSGGSDHAVFYNRGIPVAFLHTGLHRYYHTPDDDAHRINYEGMEKVAKYAFELAWRICQSDKRPKFNQKDFKPMHCTHDHGHRDVPFHVHQEKR